MSLRLASICFCASSVWRRLSENLNFENQILIFKFSVAEQPKFNRVQLNRVFKVLDRGLKSNLLQFI